MADRKHRFGASRLTPLQVHRLSKRIDSGSIRLTGIVHTVRTGPWKIEEWNSGTLTVEGSEHLVPFVARGVGPLEVGRTVEVEGFFEEPTEFGPQFKIDRVVRAELPSEERALVRYLSANVPGVGESRARRIVRIFGSETLNRLRTDPQIPERLWPGSTGRAVSLGVAEWAKRAAIEDWSFQMAPSLMAAGDIGYPLAVRICSYFGSADVAHLITHRDPYRLLEVPGVGWKTVDHMARAMEIKGDHPARCRGAVKATLHDLRQAGHTAVPRSLLIAGVQKLIKVPRKPVSRALAAMAADAEIIRANGLLYDEPALVMEWDVSGLVSWLRSLDRRLAVQEERKVGDVLERYPHLTTEQRDAVRMVLSHGVSILTGGPGTGKTTVLRTVLESARSIGLDVLMVAPTGKAASRATQVTGERAQTIHKLLGGPSGGEREKGPIRRGLLMVEEASMLDLQTAAWLAANIAPGRDFRLVLIGDENQLPSVGHGQVLSDLLTSGALAASTLTRIQRQGKDSTITKQAYRLLNNEPLSREETADFRFVELPEDTKQAQRITLSAVSRVIEEERSSLLRRLDRKEFDACRELQVLTPLNGGPLGVEVLNPLLGARMNPRSEQGPWIGGGQCVRMGDRVMCTENDYSVGEEGIFNGEQGIVTGYGEKHVELRMDDGRSLRTAGVQNGLLTLAFATTIHKSQGSEYPVVIVIFHSSQHTLLDRRVLYTALTRAKQRVVLCADSLALEKARASFTAASHRWTGLARMIQG